MLGEEHTLRVFERRVLRRLFGPNSDEVTRDWRKLHDEELYNLYILQNVVRMIKSRRLRWLEHVSFMGEMRNVYRILDGNFERMKLLERHRHR
jgi:hypothetical protein